jgi:quercetin dioxygenase-like cupin family protein
MSCQPRADEAYEAGRFVLKGPTAPPGKKVKTGPKARTAYWAHYPPGGKMPPHHHAPSAFVTCYVLSGAIRNQLHGGHVQILKPAKAGRKGRVRITS